MVKPIVTYIRAGDYFSKSINEHEQEVVSRIRKLNLKSYYKDDGLHVQCFKHEDFSLVKSIYEKFKEEEKSNISYVETVVLSYDNHLNSYAKNYKGYVPDIDSRKIKICVKGIIHGKLLELKSKYYSHLDHFDIKGKTVNIVVNEDKCYKIFGEILGFLKTETIKLDYKRVIKDWRVKGLNKSSIMSSQKIYKQVETYNAQNTVNIVRDNPSLLVVEPNFVTDEQPKTKESMRIMQIKNGEKIHLYGEYNDNQKQALVQVLFAHTLLTYNECERYLVQENYKNFEFLFMKYSTFDFTITTSPETHKSTVTKRKTNIKPAIALSLFISVIFNAADLAEKNFSIYAIEGFFLTFFLFLAYLILYDD